MTRVSRKLRESARGQNCSLRIPGICNFNTETTVLAHINSVGKGMGIKSEDFFAVFSCSSCHAALDEHRIPGEDVAAYTLSALYETWRMWFKNGIISVHKT